MEERVRETINKETVSQSCMREDETDRGKMQRYYETRDQETRGRGTERKCLGDRTLEIEALRDNV